MEIRDTIRTFFEKYPERSYGSHEMLLHAEEPVTAVYYLAEGQVSQYDIAQSGNEVVVNVFKPGAFFPMSAAINHTENHYFFEANRPVKVRVAPTEDVLQFLHAHPEVTFDLLSRVYRGVDGVIRRMAHLMGGGAQSRFIFELLNAAARFGEQQSDGSVMVAITENELAKRSGLARETVSRTLQSLKAAGLITTSRAGVVITSTAELEARLGTGL